MSIWHSLQFESTKSKEEIFSFLLSSGVGLMEYSNGFETDGIYGRVSELSAYSQSGMEEYGFLPKIRITFDEDSDGDIKEGEKTMGKAVALILQQEKGDAIFFYVVDTPILKRINGHLQVADDSYFDWLRSALNETGLEYELKAKEEILKYQN